MKPLRNLVLLVLFESDGCLLPHQHCLAMQRRVNMYHSRTAPCLQVPAGLTRLFKNPTLDWNLDTTKQPAMSDREMYLARGKLLGGSSSTNATLYHRGSAADYDGWDLPGWTGDDVLPWFVNMEDNPAFGNSKYHSTGTAPHTRPSADQPPRLAQAHGLWWSYQPLNAPVLFQLVFKTVPVSRRLLGPASTGIRRTAKTWCKPRRPLKRVAGTHAQICMHGLAVQVVPCMLSSPSTRTSSSTSTLQRPGSLACLQTTTSTTGRTPRKATAPSRCASVLHSPPATHNHT